MIYDITPEQGKKILESGINIASNNPKYDLFTNNCSQIAQKMLMAGGVTQLQTVIPKDVYKSNAIFSDGVIENGK